MDSTNYSRCVSNFPSTLLAKSTMVFQQSNHCAYSSPIPQAGTQNKDFDAVSKAYLLCEEFDKGIQVSLRNCSNAAQITTERTNNTVQPQRYPKIGSTKSYYNLLWITIVQMCCSSSMEFAA